MNVQVDGVNTAIYRIGSPRSNLSISNISSHASTAARPPLENLAWACHRCNRHKGPNLTGIDPNTQEITPLFHPRRALWSAHFMLRGIELIGLTPAGRATVTLLQMNAARRVERRAELIQRGWF